MSSFSRYAGTTVVRS